MTAPPLESMQAPVMKQESSLSRNAITRACSSGLDQRRIGMAAAMRSNSSCGVARCTSGVRVAPGQKAFARMPARPELAGDVPREAHHAVLGGRVVGAAQHTRRAPGERGHVHDDPAALLEHDRDDGVAAEEGPAQVDAHHQVPLGDGHVGELRAPQDAGAGHEEVDPAEGGARRSPRRLDLGLRGYVHFFDQRFWGAVGSQSRRPASSARFVDVDQRQARAGMRQMQRGRPPDPARGARSRCRTFP